MFKFTLLIPANYPEGGCPVSVQYVSRLSFRKLFKRGRGDKSLRFLGDILCFVCQLNNGSWEHVPQKNVHFGHFFEHSGVIFPPVDEPCYHGSVTYCMLSAKLQEFDFQAGVYHPLINYETGELETKQEFQRWRYCSPPSQKFLHSPWFLILPHTPPSHTSLTHLPHTPPSHT